MRINSPAERIALNPPRSPKPILYWEATKGSTVIAENNSIAILRAKYGASVIYKAIR